MGTKEKLIEHFKSLPKDFTFDELTSVLTYFGYEIDYKGICNDSSIGRVEISRTYLA